MSGRTENNSFQKNKKMTETGKRLLMAVKKQLGDNWECHLRTAYEQGMGGGIPHFTNINEMVKFYDKHRSLILRYIAEEYGYDPSPVFNELSLDYTEAERMRLLYGVSEPGDYSDYIKDNVIKRIVCDMAELQFDR